MWERTAMTTGTVLVVDDDPSIIDFIHDALTEEGYTVEAAVGAGALPMAATLQPDVILLDIMMPGMDGVEVSKHLRADPITAHIPIVVMSAQDRLNAAGSMLVNGRLPKPFDLSSLFDTVARWAVAP